MLLLLIRGLPSSGKTTLAKQFNTPFHYEADMYMEATGGWAGAKLETAHRWCLSMAQSAMESKAATVVVSNTFVKKEHMAPYKDAAALNGYEVVEITLHSQYPLTKDIPEHTIERMRREFEA